MELALNDGANSESGSASSRSAALPPSACGAVSVSSVPNGSMNSTSSIVGGGAAKKAKGSADLASSPAAGADDSGNVGDVASPGDGGIAPNGFVGGAASLEGADGVFGAPKGLDDTGGGAPKGMEGFSPSEASLGFEGAPKGVDGGVPNGLTGFGGMESRLISPLVSISVDGGFDAADENGLAGDSVFFAKGLADAAPAGGADPKGEAGAFVSSDSSSPASFFWAKGLAGDSVFFAKGLAAPIPAVGGDPKGEAGAFVASDSSSPVSFFWANGLADAAPAGGADPKGEAGALVASDSSSPVTFF